jgi:hypothetical protein
VGLVSTGPLISRTSSLRSVARLTACRASLLLNGGTRANSGDDTVQQINLSSNDPDLLIRVGAKPDGLALAGRSLWVSSGRDGQSSNLTARRASRSDHPSRAGAGAMGLQDGVSGVPGAGKTCPSLRLVRGWSGRSLRLRGPDGHCSVGSTLISRVAMLIGVGGGLSTYSSALEWLSPALAWRGCSGESNVR